MEKLILVLLMSSLIGTCQANESNKSVIHYSHEEDGRCFVGRECDFESPDSDSVSTVFFYQLVEEQKPSGDPLAQCLSRFKKTRNLVVLAKNELSASCNNLQEWPNASFKEPSFEDRRLSTSSSKDSFKDIIARKELEEDERRLEKEASERLQKKRILRVVAFLKNDLFLKSHVLEGRGSYNTEIKLVYNNPYSIDSGVLDSQSSLSVFTPCVIEEGGRDYESRKNGFSRKVLLIADKRKAAKKLAKKLGKKTSTDV